MVCLLLQTLCDATPVDADLVLESAIVLLVQCGEEHKVPLLWPRCGNDVPKGIVAQIALTKVSEMDGRLVRQLV